MLTKNINGVIEEMTQKEYEEKLSCGMKLEIVKELKIVKEKPEVKETTRAELLKEAKKLGIETKNTDTKQILVKKINDKKNK